MKYNIKTLIFIFIGISGISFGQAESRKADSSLVKNKSSVLKSANTEISSSDSQLQGETRSSGVIKPEPVIIYRDEEKVLVNTKEGPK